MKNLKLLSTILLVAMLVSVFIMPTWAISDPAPEATAVVLVDALTGNILYAKNENEPLPQASLTKIMTVMLAVEAIERGEAEASDLVTASSNMQYDLIADGSSAGIQVGEIMTLEDLMYCAMVKSANEACNIIAEHISGSISAFVARMNERAAALGCTTTNFVNTHGLPANNHYTTAYDLAIISQAAVGYPLFADISDTAEIIIPATNMSEARHLINTNGLITENAEHYEGYYYEAASGVKTGHTDAAGYCLVSTAKKNGISLLCVVMGGKATAKQEGMSYGSFTDSIDLYNWAFENFSYRDILKLTDIVADVPVIMGADADFVSLHPQNSIRALLPNDDDLQSFVQKTIIYSEETGEELIAPIAAGLVLGEISIERDGVIYGSSKLVSTNSVDLSYSQYIKNRLDETMKKPVVLLITIVVAVLILGYLLLVIRYQISKGRYYAKRRGEKSAASALPRASVPVKADSARIEVPVARAPTKSATSQTAPIKPVQMKPKTLARSVPEVPKPASKPEPQLEQQPGAEPQAERDYFEEFFGNKK